MKDQKLSIPSLKYAGPVVSRAGWYHEATCRVGRIRGNSAGTEPRYASNFSPNAACRSFSSSRMRIKIPMRENPIAANKAYQYPFAIPVAIIMPNMPV